MRKIETAEEIAKRKKRNQLLVSGVLILIMVVSTAGFAFFSSPDTNPTGNQDAEKITYNGLEFKINQNGLWEFIIQGQAFTTIYNPEDTKDIEANFVGAINDYSNKPLYYALSNPEAAGEIDRNIGRYSERSQEICLQEAKAWQNCTSDLVVKNCTSNIFVFRNIVGGNKTNIYKTDNCVFIETEYSEQTKASDRVVFKILGIQ
ncbi:hypothetical protein HYW74_00685 [Candidatus Pacearchaeota archaeon]|nr:hypothetical protein [Candidatus Pacearchaeota archaeon]